MSGLLRPVGPEAAPTYWVRRGLVVGATMVLAVAVLLIISGTSSRGTAVHANSSPTAGYSVPSPASPSSMQTATHTPSTIDPSGSPSSTAPEPNAATRKASTNKTDRSGPVDCTADDLRPTLTGKQLLASNRPATFQLSLINGSDQTCVARVTRKNFELKIYSGSDRIWSTADCRSAINPITRKLGSEHAVAWSLTWDGRRSKSNCKSAPDAPGPGTYVATAQLEGAEPVQLRMRLGDSSSASDDDGG
jgi:hypothetical protein